MLGRKLHELVRIVGGEKAFGQESDDDSDNGDMIRDCLHGYKTL